MIKTNKTVNLKSRLVSDIVGIIFYSFGLISAPVFWIFIDFWVFKIGVVTCILVCILNIISNSFELKKIRKLMKQGKTEMIVGGGNDEPRTNN